MDKLKLYKKENLLQTFFIYVTGFIYIKNIEYDYMLIVK